MNWLRYANEGKIRNQPLSPELEQALGYLGDMGVTVEVFSGGQDHKGHGHRRTGSTRHDGGNAADVFFYKDGRRLNWADPNDLPLFQEIVQQGKSAGLTGFGAGPGYMPEGSMHIGFGTPAVWGAGGKGDAAPDWLREAYGAAGAASAPLSTGSASAPSYPSQETAAGTLYTGQASGAYGNALAHLSEPMQKAVLYNALASMFQPQEQPMYQLQGY